MAGRGRPKSSLILTREERSTLQHWARRRTIGALALRSRMVLASADGHANNVVAEQFGVSPQTAGKWWARFIRRRLEGLDDEPRPGAPRKVTDDFAARVVTRTLQDRVPNLARWSTRSMARATGLSQSTIARIWLSHGLRVRAREGIRPPSKWSARPFGCPGSANDAYHGLGHNDAPGLLELSPKVGGVARARTDR